MPARVEGAESPTTARPQDTSGPDRIAPQEPLDKSADRAEPVYRESGKKLQVDSIPTETLPLPEALELYLVSIRLQKNREELMMATGLADLKYLNLWGLEFNSHLLTEGREDTKVMMDYCSHFSRWLKKQPTHTHPDPKTFNTAKEDAKRTSSDTASAGSGNSNKPGKAAPAKTSSRTRNQYLDEQQ